MRLRLSYANVVATLALVLATGGGVAVAADELARNSVGTKQLKKDAVVGAKVKDGSLLAADFAVGQLPAGPVGPQGPQGARGLQGVPGTPGPQGAAGANAATYIGAFNAPGSLAAYTCYEGSANASSFKPGDTAVLAPDYYNAAVGANFQVAVGQVNVAGSLPFTMCNISGATSAAATTRVDVYRVVGPSGPKPAAAELKVQLVG